MDDNAQSSTTAATNPPEAVGDNTPADTDTTVTFEYRGLRWVIPRARNDWDMNVQFEFEDGNRLRGLMVLLAGGPAKADLVRRQLYSVCKTQGELAGFIRDAFACINKHCT